MAKKVSKPIIKMKKTDTSGNSSKDEQIGFHKGSLSTLAKERQELTRILQIVEQLMQMHVAALNELGVDLQKEIDQMKKETPMLKWPQKSGRYRFYHRPWQYRQ